MTKLKIIAVAVASTALTPALAQAQMKGMAMPSTADAKTGVGVGVGVVKAVDTKAGTVTIQHGAIPGVGWPAMTMSFNVSRPILLRSIKVAQHVRFTVNTRGSTPEVTAIESQR